MYKLVFFVPSECAEPVKQALFDAGGGAYERYDSCCWQTSGTGQFRPLAGSTPYVGREGEVEYVTELRVEMVCDDHVVRPVLKALLAAHPYEEPAYEVYRIRTARDFMCSTHRNAPGG